MVGGYGYFETDVVRFPFGFTHSAISRKGCQNRKETLRNVASYDCCKLDNNKHSAVLWRFNGRFIRAELLFAHSTLTQAFFSFPYGVWA
jgi:hypothetical protein